MKRFALAVFATAAALLAAPEAVRPAMAAETATHSAAALPAAQDLALDGVATEYSQYRRNRGYGRPYGYRRGFNRRRFGPGFYGRPYGRPYGYGRPYRRNFY